MRHNECGSGAHALEPHQFRFASEEKRVMTTMTRFVPFRSALSDVAVLQNRLNSIFNDFARPEGTQENLAASE